MKNTLLLITTLAAATAVSTAGDFSEPITPTTPTITAPSGESKLSGTLSLDLNSHFVSLTDQWTFNPSLSLDYALNDAITISAGFWLDVNDNIPAGDFESQETDIWIGASYTTGITTVSATFQNWQYAGDSEEILDIGISLDTFLSPSLTIHHRIDEGASGGNDGTFLVLGLGHSFDINDKLSLSIPFSLGFAADEFHTDESGYGFASLGLQASYAINSYTSFNAGVTYYTTDDEVVANAEEDDFLTANAGISFSF